MLNENEKNFMDELHDLFRKYNIDTVCIREHDVARVAFYSNEREFAFAAYREGNFISIISESPKYAPYLDKTE